MVDAGVSAAVFAGAREAQSSAAAAAAAAAATQPTTPNPTHHKHTHPPQAAPSSNAVLDSRAQRIDGTDKRETLFSAGGSKRNSWLSEGGIHTHCVVVVLGGG